MMTKVLLGNPLVVTMGMGQINKLTPAMVLIGTSEYYTLIEAFREALRGDGAEDTAGLFEDDIAIYKIAAMLYAVNQAPLSNPLFNRITRLVLDKKVKIDVDLTSQTSRKSEPYRIVIGEHRIIRENK
jgi:hypothetical protein